MGGVGGGEMGEVSSGAAACEGGRGMRGFARENGKQNVLLANTLYTTKTPSH